MLNRPLIWLNAARDRRRDPLDNAREALHETGPTRSARPRRTSSPSLAWVTKQFQVCLSARQSSIQCAYGATIPDDNGVEQPILNTTRISTTKWAIFEIMTKRCDGSHQRQRLEGRNRCRRAENYQDEMAAHLVRALLLDEGLHEQVYAVSEDAAPLTGALRKLASNQLGSRSDFIATLDTHGKKSSSMP